MTDTAKMTNFTFKMDQKTRDDYGSLCRAFGLTMSSATLALIKQAIRDQSINLTLKDENGFAPEEAKELQRRIHDVEKGHAERHELGES